MTLIYFVLILGLTVMIHETGHFIFAKKAGVYVYEFSIGMGPRLFKWKRSNDETEYSIRLLPIGGFVSLAGEDPDEDEDVKIPKGKSLQDKSTWQNFMTMSAGVLFNFILALVLLFIVGLCNGYTNTKPIVGEVTLDSPADVAGIRSGDIIESVNGHFTNNIDKLMLELTVNKSEDIEIKFVRNGVAATAKVSATKETDDKGNVSYKCGFSVNQDTEHGFIAAIKYAFTKFFSLFEQMIFIIWYLLTGKLAFSNLSGPVGIYNLVGETAKTGFVNLIYLMGYISLNVGFINFLPFPAFDGGRVFMLLIEKITGKKIDPKVENMINSIGFILLMFLMIFITFNDISNLIK